MVYIYVSHACQAGNHENCSGGEKDPKGHFGGSVCTCACHHKKELKNKSMYDIIKEYDKED